MPGLIDEIYMKEFENDNKIGLLSTVDPEGYPHITLITTIQAKSGNELVWGQFCQGMSKKNVEKNPRIGFLILTRQMELWRGRANWTHTESTGPEFEVFNNKPLFRYNSYFGIGKVHYMDLVNITEKEKLNMGSIAFAAILTRIAKAGVKKKGDVMILNEISNNLLNNMTSLKFISYVDEGGFPVIIPIIQAAAAHRDRIIFSTKQYRGELESIPTGVKAAVYCVNLDMESVLVKGVFAGVKGICGIKAGILDIEKVYNPMVPKAGYIYPQEELTPIREFTVN